MVRAIIEFAIFAAVGGGAIYLFVKKSALKSDLQNDHIIK